MMPKITRKEKALTALSYLPLLVFLPFFLGRQRKDAPFMTFHAKRGMLLFTVECCLSLPLAFLARALTAFWNPLGGVVYILMALLACVFLFLALYGIALVMHAQMRDIPLFFGYTPKSENELKK